MRCWGKATSRSMLWGAAGIVWLILFLLNFWTESSWLGWIGSGGMTVICAYRSYEAKRGHPSQR